MALTTHLWSNRFLPTTMLNILKAVMTGFVEFMLYKQLQHAVSRNNNPGARYLQNKKGLKIHSSQ